MKQWIWNFGDFEIYHNMLLHNRRQQYGHREPVTWKLYAPEPVVRFKKKFTTEGGLIRMRACGIFTAILIGEHSYEKYAGQEEIWIPAGTWEILIVVENTDTFPCVIVDGVVQSDDSWLCDDMTGSWGYAGTSSLLTSFEHTPEEFPFQYEEVRWTKKENLKQGVLYDFGRELYAQIQITDLKDLTVTIRYGESKEEALDPQWCVIRFQDRPVNGILSYRPYAFRYIYISDPSAQVEAQLELLPEKNKGSFICEEEIINQVWNTAAYTFHLNCREFILDGIKRDGWVWSADAYQSLFVNHYLFLDQDLEKRTLIALGGKAPFKAHINTIMDYTFFWVISLYEYYKTYGDKKFLSQIYPQLRNVMEFCFSREDEDGFMRGREGDWIFIDWAPMDKDGALCGEQILYAKALECYGKINELLDISCKEVFGKAVKLQCAVQEKFYNPEKGAFIDCYESGRNNITRQNNLLAYLFLPCTKKQKADIYKNVILNDNVPQITTPYFKFYENQVHCLEGNNQFLEKSIREYFGGMLKLGATTLFEEYDPSKSGAEHYAMYGRPFEKSLCHAWSASPIYLLGRFCIGVENTGIAYSSFAVRPNLGELKSFSGKVPTPGGTIFVKAGEETITVFSEIEGGTLYIGEKEYPLEAGKELTVKR